MSDTMFKAVFVFTCLVIFILGISLLGAAIMHVRKPEVQNPHVVSTTRADGSTLRTVRHDGHIWVVGTQGLHGVSVHHHPECPCGGNGEKE